MKAQFRSILFALVLPAAACGGGHETPKSDETVTVPLPKLPVDSSVTKPAEPKPAVVEIAVPTKYDDALALGRELVGKGELGKAKEMFEAAIKLDQKKADPHIEMSRMFIAMNEKGLSIASAKKAIKLAPLSSQAWNTKGRAELNAHNYDNAVEAFSKAAELNQDNAFAWNNLGYTELLLKKYEDAAEHLIEATTKKGATGYMFNNLGTALEHLDRLDEARTAYEAGGKLGSKEAVTSRKRLEGVKTIVVVKDEIKGEVHDEARAEASKTKEYDLTDEGDVVDEDKVDDAATSEESTTDESIENSTTESKIEAPEATTETPDAGVPEMNDDMPNE